MACIRFSIQHACRGNSKYEAKHKQICFFCYATVQHVLFHSERDGNIAACRPRNNDIPEKKKLFLTRCETVGENSGRCMLCSNVPTFSDVGPERSVVYDLHMMWTICGDDLAEVLHKRNNFNNQKLDAAYATLLSVH